MITIKSIECSGGACPYQIEATTTSGAYFYLRYRWSRLRAGVAESAETFQHTENDYNIINESIGDPMDGMADHETISKALEGKVVFPADFYFSYDNKRPDPFDHEQFLGEVNAWKS